MKIQTLFVAAVVGCSAAWSQQADAQALAERVPADALVYVGWRGTNAPGDGYEQSRLKPIVEASKIRELLSDFLPRLAKRVALDNNADAGRAVQTVNDIVTPMLKYPTAVYFAGLTGEGRNTLPKIGVLCQAGADAPTLAKRVNDLLATMPRRDVQGVEAHLNGDLFVLTVGYDNPSAVGANLPTATLGPRADFASSLAPVHGQGAWLVAYADMTGIFDLVKTRIENKKDGAQFTTILNAAGLGGLHGVTYAAGFDGRDWMSRTFVDAPAPRSGLLALGDDEGSLDKTLALIPADATFALAGRADLAKFVKETRVAVEKVDPEAAKMFDRGIGAITMALGKQLVPDLLEPLGPDWALYSSPTVAGTGIMGTVAVNRLDDPAKLKQALPQAWISMSNWLGVAMGHAGDGKLTVAGQSVRVDGRYVYYLGIPLVSPSWTIAGDTLYVGLYTQSAIAGARRAGQQAQTASILNNDKFLAVQKRLGVEKPRSISFYDLPVSASYGSGYQTMMVLSSYAGMGDMFGVPIAQPLLPPLDVILQQVTPAGSASWTDAAGLHSISVSPFPGSGLLSEQAAVSSVGVGGGALMTSILLPSLNRARETANRVKCASNMRTVGQAILLYANENKFKYPPDLGTLVATQEIAAECFVCPSGTTVVPPGMKPEDAAKWVNENSDYVYVGKGLTTSVNADTIVLYEKPNAHDNDGMNILYGDGHVEFQMNKEAQKQINHAAEPQGGGL